MSTPATCRKEFRTLTPNATMGAATTAAPRAKIPATPRFFCPPPPPGCCCCPPPPPPPPCLQGEASARHATRPRTVLPGCHVEHHGFFLRGCMGKGRTRSLGVGGRHIGKWHKDSQGFNNGGRTVFEGRGCSHSRGRWLRTDLVPGRGHRRSARLLSARHLDQAPLREGCSSPQRGPSAAKKGNTCRSNGQTQARAQGMAVQHSGRQGTTWVPGECSTSPF